MTRLNGDEGGFKLTVQALSCGVEELADDSMCCLCSRELLTEWGAVLRLQISYVAAVNVARAFESVLNRQSVGVLL